MINPGLAYPIGLVQSQSDPMPDPQLIQIKKYPNRRLYDQTRSRHLTHEELYDLVVAGHTVAVTDSKSGQDITNLVLTQALIERTPEKFATLPPELLHLMIRAGDQMLRTFTSTWFAQMMKGMAPMAVPQMPMPGMPWANAAGFPWAAPGPSITPQPATDPLAEMRAKLEAMMRELAEMKSNKPS